MAAIDPERVYTASQLRVILGDKLAETVMKQAGLPPRRRKA